MVMSSLTLFLKRHLHLIGIAFLVAGVVTWMRLTGKHDQPAKAFRSRDALVVSMPKRRTQPVSSLDGRLVGAAASADSIELWTADQRLLTKSVPDKAKSFALRFGKIESAKIALVARMNGRLLAVIPVIECDRFTDIELGATQSVTFSTRFVDSLLKPLSVNVSGSVRAEQVTIPIDTKVFLSSASTGDLVVPGLPANGFVSLEILNPEYAQTFALTEIALRAGKIRSFPRVKVFSANRIAGRVIDSFGHPKANSRVTIDTNIRYFRMPDARTDEFGNFSFTRLPNGVYSVQALGDVADAMCSVPVSEIQCASGKTEVVPDITFQAGNYVTFSITDTSESRTQPVILKIYGEINAKRWFLTRFISRTKPTKLLVPQGLVYFEASQESRNGIMPLSRNVTVSPNSLYVTPGMNQVVTINIVPRRR